MVSDPWQRSSAGLLFLLLADRKAKAEFLGKLVFRVESVGEVDATHTTVGMYLHSSEHITNERNEIIGPIRRNYEKILTCTN